MKKLVSIFLLVLYAMSVSASVVTVRYCDVMKGEVAIGTLENQDCCCKDGGQMDMSPDISSDLSLTLRTGKYTHTADTNAADLNTVYTSIPQSCCSEIVLQSKISANQIISSETNKGQDQAPQLLPVTRFDFLVIEADASKLHQPLAIALKSPPSTIALYKLFQRFTYYG